MGIAGITLSTSCVTLFNAIFLGLFIRKKIELVYYPLFTNLFKMSLCGVFVYFICYGISEWINSLMFYDNLCKITKICVVTSVCVVVYSIFNCLFKVGYALELWNRLKNNILRKF